MAKDDLEDSKTCVKILKNTYERCSVPLNVYDSHKLNVHTGLWFDRGKKEEKIT